MYNTATAEPTSTLNPGKGWNVNEVICFRLYTSESRDYGMPRDVALALEYAGDKLASEYNVSFFDAGGTPPTLLFIHSAQDEGQGQPSRSRSRRRRSSGSRTPSRATAATAIASASSRFRRTPRWTRSRSGRSATGTWAS
jgi:phage portal protein BeeE